MEMRDEARADVAHDAFADERVEIALEDADPGRDQRRAEDDPDVDRRARRDCWCGIATSMMCAMMKPGTRPSAETATMQTSTIAC